MQVARLRRERSATLRQPFATSCASSRPAATCCAYAGRLSVRWAALCTLGGSLYLGRLSVPPYLGPQLALAFPDQARARAQARI